MAVPSPQTSIVAAVRRFGDLAAEGGGGLLAAARARCPRGRSVLEAGDPDDHAEAAAVGHGHALGVELFPAVLVVGQGGIGFRFGELGLVGFMSR